MAEKKKTTKKATPKKSGIFKITKSMVMLLKESI